MSKSRRGAYVVIPPAYVPELSAALAGLAPDARVVKLTAKSAAFIMRGILKNAGIAGKTLYGWKHAGATEAYRSGVGIKDVQRQARHTTVTTTDIYLRSLGAADYRGAFAAFAML